MECNNTTQQLMLGQNATTTSREENPGQYTGAAETVVEMDHKKNSAAEDRRNPQQVTQGAIKHIAKNTQQIVEVRDHAPPNSELLRSQPKAAYQQAATKKNQARRLIAPQEPNHLLQQKIDFLQTKYAASLERGKLIDKDNQQKSILYATALEKIH